jgi:hypothetical protein
MEDLGMKTKDIIGLIILIVITLYFGGTLLSYFRTGEAYGVTEFLLIIALLVAWGDFLRGGYEEKSRKMKWVKILLKEVRI